MYRRIRASWIERAGLVALILAALVVAVAGCTSVSSSTQGASTTAFSSTTTGSTSTASTSALAGLVGTTASGVSMSPAEVVAPVVSPSVVHVRVSGVVTSPFFGQEPYEGVGSGVIYRSDGYIVTNDHVISESGQASDSIEVTFATGETVPATVVGRDSFTDVAVIKVDKTNLPAATFVSSSDVRVGQYAIAIGSPMDYRNSVTLGIVSGLGRTVEGSGSTALVDLIQVDAAISPGNSGGAVADASGRVFGIAVAYLPPQSTGAENIGFAIPADTVVSIADQLIATGKASHPYIGIQYVTVTSAMQRQYRLSRASGVLITAVGNGTPAAQAGLQVGDIIVAIDGAPVEDEGDVVVTLRRKAVGDTLNVTIDRDGKELNLSVTLAERPTTFTVE